MKTNVFSFLALAAIIGLIATTQPSKAGDCLDGSGNIVGENHAVRSFHKIIVETEATVILSQDKSQSLHVQADDNLQNVIETKIDNGTLKISVPKCVNPSKNITVFVSMNDVDELTLAGNGKILAPSSITTENIKFVVSGSGEIKFDEVHAEHITTQVLGNGTITLRGNAISHTVESVGSGEVHAYDLKAINSKLSVAGAGKCEVNADNQLDVKITGSGSVSYNGNPETLHKEITGSGSLKNRN
ncbi:MAG: head GIN domain-containing protein [Candidatus Kapaibacterium sp.]